MYKKGVPLFATANVNSKIIKIGDTINNANIAAKRSSNRLKKD
ncbi:hypothetical protein JCM19301_2210 [Jejuia pallidilutea]|uniref:Uncharacterized protein n=1 Tax=Jejuia pallidilutea TaxID=504487 RepID=A0A090W5L9_9FLAO|nr:hypothetical protein JCM19301_2210 [Jejuia pallidilutea]GAL70754.1 hypothetical protein JCM19302_2476 [Jejuia pallidilutea]